MVPSGDSKEAETELELRLSQDSRMPRRLTEAEERGSRLFRHLQWVSILVIALFPCLGGVYGGWVGAAVGLVAGWLTCVWMRRSMGIRGPDSYQGFFVRMRERAHGAPRGILGVLIETVRRRPFTQEQCAAMTTAWDEARRRLAVARSEEERRVLLEEFDAHVKLISYGLDERRIGPKE
jgi:hypothetical protein